MDKLINKILHLFFEQITVFGGVVFYLFIIFLSFSFKSYNFGTYLIFSLILVMMFGILIKILYFKERPKKQQYSNILEKIDAGSFPSIHTMRITSLVFWFVFFFRNSISSFIVIGVALLVAFSRIFLKKHYFSDVFFGVVFAVIINFILKWYI
ncbi:phosphatase PAP2 family protein [archaeon]|jgi:undecaprenyl-diphosphatase|nr:phosphatase PAP2 family protein [archaeon]